MWLVTDDQDEPFQRRMMPPLPTAQPSTVEIMNVAFCWMASGAVRAAQSTALSKATAPRSPVSATTVLLNSVALVKSVAGATGRGIILRSTNPQALEAALQALPGQRPLIHAATPANAETIAALALKYKAPLVARAATLDELAALTTKLAALGVKDMVLDLPADNPAAALQYNTIIRKAALKAFEPLGYPIMNFVSGHDAASIVADACTLMCKYASILVLDRMDYELLLPVMMLRQNIYTDPQKPIQVEPKVYPVGEPGPDSPVIATTNFSLTYFLVSGEIENSGVPAKATLNAVPLAPA